MASQVTATLFPDAANMAFAPGLGIAIHLVLSLLVALFYAALVWLPFVRRFGPAASMAVASAALASIWAINFLVVLPVLNPIFVSLLPHAVTFGSKILFGIAMAGVLMGAQRQRDDEEPGVSRRIVV